MISRISTIMDEEIEAVAARPVKNAKTARTQTRRMATIPLKSAD